MADVNISKYTTQVVREGSKPATPGFVVSEGQDPVNPPGTNNYVPYSGATANVELGEFGLETGFVNLDTTPTNIPTEQGGIYWDDTRSTAALIMNGTLQHIGQDVFYYVKNSSGSTIAKGTSVRFDGTDGASGHLLIAPFLADGTYASTYFMGVTAEEILNGEFGQVMHFGELDGIDTSGYTAGDLLYASTTVAGGFQTTAPIAPNNIVLIAAAVNSKNNGAIIVRPTYGSNINTDEGVKITTPTTGDLLQLQAGGLWENKAVATVMSNYVTLDTGQTITGQKFFANNTLTLNTTGNANSTILTNSIGASTYQSGRNFFGFNTDNHIYFAKSSNTGVNTGILAWTNTATRTYTLKDASGTLAFTSDIPANPVGGTGTTNYLPKFTGASTIGNSQVFDNGTNVGIGTTSPGARLEISSGTEILRLRTNNSDNYFTYFNSSGSQVGDIGYDGRDTNILSIWNGVGGILLGANGSERARITSGGNLLVGTTTDAGFKLDVNGTGRFVNNVSGGATNVLTITNAASTVVNTEARLFLSTVTGNDRGAYISAIITSASNDNALIFATNAAGASPTERMRITSAGNVGIGTATITQPSAGATTLRIVGTVTNKAGAIFLASSDSSVSAYIYPDSISGLSINTSTAHPIVFRTSATERMRITSGGNVLIGTTTDAGFKLHVNGTGRFSGNLSLQNIISPRVSVEGNSSTGFPGFNLSNTTQGYEIIVRSNISNAFQIRNTTANTNLLTINTSGNVGIGTTDIEETLTVAKIGGGDGTIAGFRSDASFSQFEIETKESQGSFGLNTVGSRNIYFSTNSTERMRITSGGNVLIGTTTDNGAKLNVNGGGTFSGSVIVGTTALLNFGPTSNFVGMSGNNSNGSLQLFANNTQVLGFAASTGLATLSSLGTGTVTATAGTLSTVSDLSYKISDGFIDSAIQKVLSLKPRYFYWNEKSGLPKDIRQLGFYAQEVNKALGEEAANTPQDKNTPWGISDRSIIAMLTKAIQEQQAQIDSLKNQIK
jgi:hypothetical protein